MDNNYYDIEKLKKYHKKIFYTMITHKSYNIVFYSNGLYIDDLYVTNMHTAIGQALYSINHTNIIIIDQVKIYKVGKLVTELVAELNK